MEPRKNVKGHYMTRRQKKKLVELMAKHPRLISFRPTADFSTKDSERLWHKIANECNSIPGAKKTWRQWRKTWQDMRSNAKHRERRQQEQTNEVCLPETFTIAEQEALGIKSVSSTTNSSETVFVSQDDHNISLVNLNNETSVASFSDLESHHEEKVFTQTKICNKNNSDEESAFKHSNSCVFNCDLLAVQEQKKLQIKEDYYTFKKDYLKQKLLILKEQSEALKSIAKELAK